MSVSASGPKANLDKKEKEAEIKKAVKAEQNKKREEALKKLSPERPKQKEMTFDGWYSIRQSQIPQHHRKEVLKADFKARGCGVKQTLGDWDKLLLEYGVKL